jgi:hypothetical protein
MSNGNGEKAAEDGEECTVGRIEGPTPDLAPEHGHLMAKGQQLDLLGGIGVDKKDDEFEQPANGEISEGPELAARSVPSHRRGR